MKHHSITSFLFLLLLLAGVWSCERRSSITEALDRAENVMEQYPDSALRILESISSSSLGSRGETGRYALLMTQARIKNYIYDDSDSLITIAVDYYADKEGSNKAFYSRYYRGYLRMLKGQYLEAMDDALTARQIIEKDANAIDLARIYELVADINAGVLNADNAIKNRRLAVDYYRNAGRYDNMAFSLDELADELIYSERYTEAIEALNRISPELRDTTPNLSGFVHSTYAKALYYLDRPNEALKELEMALDIWGDMAPQYVDYITAFNIFIETGNQQKANEFMEKLIQSGRMNEGFRIKYFTGMALINKAVGDNYKALIYTDSLYQAVAQRSKYQLANNPVNIENEWHKTQAEIQQQRATNLSKVTITIVVASVLILMLAILYFRIKIKARNRETEMRIAEARALLDDITSNSDRQIKDLSQKVINLNNQIEENNTNVSSTIKGVLEQQCVLVNNLADGILDVYNDGVRRKELERRFNHEIERMRSAESIRRYVKAINESSDGFIERIHEAYPDLKERDLQFIALTMTGFSTRAVCMLLKISASNYYIIRMRLRNRVTQYPESALRSRLLEIFSK